MNLFKPGQHMSYQFYHSGLLVAVVENEDQSCLNCLPKRRLIAITQPARVGYVISDNRRVYSSHVPISIEEPLTDVTAAHICSMQVHH